MHDLKIILQQDNYKHLLLSYNDHGILSIKELIDCLKSYGKLQVNSYNLPAYQTQKKSANNHVTEYLLYLQPERTQQIFMQQAKTSTNSLVTTIA